MSGPHPESITGFLELVTRSLKFNLRTTRKELGLETGRTVIVQPLERPPGTGINSELPMQYALRLKGNFSLVSRKAAE